MHGDCVGLGGSDHPRTGYRIWCLKSERCPGHTSFVSSIALSPDGRRVASGSYAHTIRICGADSDAPKVGPSMCKRGSNLLPPSKRRAYCFRLGGHTASSASSVIPAHSREDLPGNTLTRLAPLLLCLADSLVHLALITLTSR